MDKIEVSPFLMFQGDGEAALEFYGQTFPEFELLEVQRFGADDPGPEGTIKLARFAIGDQSVLCTDNYVKHDFTFTPSFSFFVNCASEDRIRALDATLKVGGSELMPLDDYGFSRLFAWVSDRFGVSWQLNFVEK